jgi:hemin uptake protein HemP
MDPSEPPPPIDPLPHRDDSHSRASRTVTSRELLQGATELLITHRDDVYRLRITRSGKLILHK